MLEQGWRCSLGQLPMQPRVTAPLQLATLAQRRSTPESDLADMTPSATYVILMHRNHVACAETVNSRRKRLCQGRRAQCFLRGT